MATTTLEELKKLDAGAWFSARTAGTRLQSLAEVLSAAKNRVNLYLDCKSIDPDLLVREIRQARMESQVIVFAGLDVIAKIRSAAACLKSSSLAVGLAKKHGTRLHILHISTADELGLFQNDRPLAQKRITSEVCVHHLFFNSRHYPRLGNLIKCNPAIKSPAHQTALFPALLDDRLDIIATDHAPHTFAEKSQPYLQAPSGLPLVQHSLNLMLGFYWEGRISLEKIVEKMCHAPAICFKIKERGFLDEGNWADLAVIDLEKRWKIAPENILYKCGWSPLEGKTMRGHVESTIVSGHLAWHDGRFWVEKMGERLLFDA